MEPPERWDPYGRPARRTQGLLSALALHCGLERGVENEMVVLATGPDQSLQEIFQHRDCAGAGRIPGEDSRTLSWCWSGPRSALQEEKGSLRQLVEDVRAALQGSDARGLALRCNQDVLIPNAGYALLQGYS
ncbi:hypothetical protein Nmel_012624 [Mimus melanotis]